jgi:UDP-N-acetylmuramoyl-tripeptide--D-alanyl-D-alanine ligase
MRITASEVALATGGTLFGADISANGISFDSRAMFDHHAFVALRGEVDGHGFLQDAVDNGALFAIVEVGRSIPALTCVEVEDTVAALAALGRHCRNRLSATLHGRVVGITGSVGKTSTKDMVHAVLSSQFAHTHAPVKSLNNDIGVPVTIINAPDECDALIVEMGMRGFGEIARLCEIALPHIGVVTAIGDAHAERVGGVSGVVEAKSELLKALPADGTAVVNLDSELVMATAKHSQAPLITFGQSQAADVRWEILSFSHMATSMVRFTYENTSVDGEVPLVGAHMVSNAAAAIAVGVSAGISLAQCVRGLSGVVPAEHRMRWFTGRSGVRILDDSYNANSLSMSAAVGTIAALDVARKIAVLGMMAEVDDAVSAHAAIALLCKQNGIELLALETDLYGTAALTLDEVVNALAGLDESAVILVKGSRVAATERVIQLLTD